MKKITIKDLKDEEVVMEVKHNIDVPNSLIAFLLDIREERKYNMMLDSRKIIDLYLKSDECDKAGVKFLIGEDNKTIFNNYLAAQGELLKYAEF